eukprot:UN07393
MKSLQKLFISDDDDCEHGRQEGFEEVLLGGATNYKCIRCKIHQVEVESCWDCIQRKCSYPICHRCFGKLKGKGNQSQDNNKTNSNNR